MRGVVITKGDIGVNADSNADKISGLLVNGPAVAAAEGILGVVNGTLYTLEKVKDAEYLGINAAYDEDNDVRVYRHITEFFRMAGEGIKLYLIVGTETLTMKQLITTYGHSMVAESKGEMRRLAVAWNQPAAYAPTYVDGLEEGIRESLAEAQLLHDWTWDTDRPLNVFLEGRGINGTVAAILDLREIDDSGTIAEYGNVSLCIGQDWDYAESLTGESQKFADVGTMLGTSAGIAVNQNIGEVETLDISDAKKLIWLTAGLSNHQKITAVEDDLSDYDDKGYIFGISYTGSTGFRWNYDHTCTPEIVDVDGFMNENTIALGLTLGKAARELRKQLLPKVKTVVPVDSETGLLSTGMVKYFEGLGNVAFDGMAGRGEISGGETIVDPNSDLLTGDKELKVSFIVVPTGTIGEIAGTINLKNSL
ncbi:DUF2586 family protein [Carboxylicivirga linearis]|uniref:DUF2586 family protein n=1 Tax=Carboxylicivirga linearis TaxID=1628157 RepID=A0ABS5K0J8_9BACT|nr:DUF2586 family protein [Carboxylicivirga linearis]MBS2100707.1 hypothetical protein [Carboxylicivirga linearis]